MRRPRRLHYTLAGDPAGAPVVYLHGAVLASTMWHAQRDAIEGQRQVFVDLPGAGGSRHLRWRSMTESARLVHDVIDAISPDQPVDLVGVSLGGDLGVRVLSLGPQRIRSAVLSGMISRPQRPWGEVWAALRDIPRIRSPKLLRSWADYNGLPVADVERLLRDTATMRYSDYARTLASVYRGMDLRAFSTVRTPVLAVCGQTEHQVAHEAVRDLVRTCPSVTGIVADDLGHAWHAEDPRRFAAITTRWFADRQLADGVARVT